MIKWLLPSAILLLLGILLYSSTAPDDKYISCWPAWTLAHGKGLVNYSLERVEMSSTLLWVLQLAAFSKLTGIQPPMLASLFAIVFGIVTIITSTFIAEGFRKGAGLYAGLLTATCLPIVNWTMGGMEATLTAGLYLWVVYSWHGIIANGRQYYTILAPTWLALMVRPEMPICLFILSLYAVWVACRKGRARDGLIILALVLIGSAALVAFRLYYFHALVPQPVMAKSGRPLLSSMHYGMLYLFKSLNTGYLWPLLLTTLFGAYRGRLHVAGRTDMLVMAALIYAAFAVASGGDFLEAGRFLVPAVSLLCILGAIWILAFECRKAVLMMLVLVQIAGCMVFAYTGQRGLLITDALRLRAMPYTRGFDWFDTGSVGQVRDMEVVRQMTDLIPRIASAKQDYPIIASHQMGIVLYYALTSSKLQVVVNDTFGLQDRILISQPEAKQLMSNTYGFYNGDAVYWRLVESGHLVAPDITYYSWIIPPYKYVQDNYMPFYVQTGNFSSLGVRRNRAGIANFSIYVRKPLFQQLQLSTIRKDFGEFRTF